jgi:putative ABC transport system permease protein
LALLDVILAVGLVTNASFFSQAVDRVILTHELNAFSSVTGRPPFSTSAYVFPSRRNPVNLENAEQVSRHVASTLSGEVGLPVRHVGMQISGGNMMLQPAPGSDLYARDQGYLGDVEVVYVADVAGHLETVEGEPFDEDGASSRTLDVWMHDRLVQEMGVQVGEILNIGVSLANTPIPIRLAGSWRAADPEDDFWFSDPDATFHDALLVRRQDYVTFVQPVIPSGSRKVDWYIVLDDSKIVPKDSASYLAGFRRGLDVINQYIPGARLNTPPLDPLEDFEQRSTTLTALLLSFNLPAFGILLYFLTLTSAIISRWQRRETAILVSRGMTVSGVLNLALLEQLLLFVVGYPLGIGFGMLIARLIGYTASFLTFTDRPPLPVSLQGLSPPLAVLALAVSLLARLWPTVRAARQSVVSEERERARPSRGPFWHRIYLDLLLLLPTWYAYRQLAQRGSLAGLIVDRPEDLYRDPLLILVPALFVLTASLLTMRLFPLVMRAIDALAGLTPSLTIHLALRQLGRQSQDYVSPLLLVIISLALGVYTFSMASSLDQWLIDRMYYRVGADLTFVPQPLSEDEEYVSGEWIPLPAEFRRMDGVTGATRVGDFSAWVDLPTGQEIRGRFLAIDRLGFPLVAWFRSDFANQSLGALMNRLALAQDGVLVSRDFLAQHNLRIGDQVPVLVGIDTDLGLRSSYTIVDTYIYFPTVYEEEKATIIGNLDFLSALLGATVPHSIWLDLEPGTDGEAIREGIPYAVHVTTSVERDTQAIIAAEQAKMERVGIFGTLSTGFAAAAVMAVLGLLIYSRASLQERVYRFAVLHAMGLSRSRIVAQVIMEYTFLAAFGALAGTLIGASASELLIPFFRFTGEQTTPLPPLLPIIASQKVGSLALGFGLVIVLTQVMTITIVLHRQVIGMLKRPWI